MKATTSTELMWDAARDFDEARTRLMEAVRKLDAAGSSAVHYARHAALTIDDGQTALAKEAGE